MKIKKIALTVLVTLCITSCRPEISLTKPEDYKIKTWGDMFTSFWSGMDHYYLYWDVDKTDWNAVWDNYKPKFDAMGNKANLQTVNDYFTDITKDLSDGHFSFTLYSGGTPAISISPQSKNVLARAEANALQLYINDWSNTPDPEYPQFSNYNFFENTINKYLENSKYGNLIATDPSGYVVFTLKSGTGHINIESTPDANDYILYLYFDGFSLTNVLMNQSYYPVKGFEILKQFFNDLCNDQNMKGVILDMRGNSGGSVDDVYLLLGPMLDRQIEIAKNRIKSGQGRLQYTPWTPLYLYPAPVTSVVPVNVPAGTGITFKRSPNAGNLPVVALVDEFSISCAEITAMAVQQMPNGYTVGKRTFGATGPRVNYTFASNGGPFNTNPANNAVIEITQAGWATQAVNGQSYEGIGVPVNQDVNLNWTIFYKKDGTGRDDQLEAAIKRIDSAHTFPTF
jgi:hypothetical protein